MAFNQPGRLPAAAEAIHRALLAARGRRLSRESLLARMRPGFKSPDTVVAATLDELVAVGAVVGGDEALSIRDDVPGGLEHGSMARVILRSIVEDGRRHDFWAEESGQLLLPGGIDLLRATTWLLTLPVAEAPWSWDGPSSFERRQGDELPVNVVYNSTRWTPFVRWAGYLGLATPFGAGGLVPDPTRALKPILADVLRGRGAQTVRSVVRRLSDDLPVLEGGAFHAALGERCDVPDGSAHLSPALSFAFARLRREGAIALDEGRGDAEKTTFADELGAYHAIRWTGASA